MRQQATLTRHAILPPAFDSTKVHRPRLVETIHANLSRKLIAVIAPAGYGKTTLLADFGRHTERPVCWLRLTEADRDVMHMADVLAASLTARFHRLKKRLRVDAMANADEAAVAGAFVRVLASVVNEPFVVVVDDVHLVNNAPSVMKFWQEFLRLQPENVNLIIAGREVPNLPLDDLLERGQVAGIGPLELSFTVSEVEELCRQTMGKEIDPADAERLTKESGGWAMGILLSGSLPVMGLGVLVQSPRPMVYDYLAAVVLNRQTPRIRKFLMESAVLPVMTAESCDEVLERRDSGRLLNECLRKGLFLTATGERPKTYEYHPRFREFLVETFKQADASLSRLVLRSSGRYLERSGAVEQAVEAYLAAGALRTAGAVARKHSRAIRLSGRTATLELWRDSFPGLNKTRGMLSFHLGASYAERGLVARANALTSEVERIARAVGSKDLVARAMMNRAMLALQQSNFLSVRKHAAKVLRLGRGVPTLVKADAHHFLGYAGGARSRPRPSDIRHMRIALRMAARLRDPNASVTFNLDLGEAISYHGTWQRTMETLRSAGPHLTSQEVRAKHPNILLGLSDAELFEGNLLEAYRYASEASKLADETANPRMKLWAEFSRGRVAALSGRSDLALEIFGTAEESAISGQFMVLMNALFMAHVDALIWRERLGEAESIAARWRGLVKWSQLPGWARMRIILAETRSAPGKFEEMMRSELKKQKKRYDVADQALARLLLAKASWATKTRDPMKDLSVAMGRADAPAVGLLLAMELSFNAEFMQFVQRASSGDVAAKVVLGLAMKLRHQRRRPPVYLRDPRRVKLEVFALRSSLDVIMNGQRIVLRRLDQEILTFLIERPSAASEQVCRAIWPDSQADASTVNLHSAVYRLRKGLGKDAIIRYEDGYRVGTIELKYDVAEFEEVCALASVTSEGSAEGRLSLVKRARALYGEGFLSGIASEWASRRRVEIHGKLAKLAEESAGLCVDQGAPDLAIALLEEALRSGDCSDGLAESLFECLARQGLWGRLSVEYTAYVRRMREELGLDVSEILSRKYSRLVESHAAVAN